jgi:molecular chaperone HtpG
LVGAEQANKQSPLWRKSPNKTTEDEYKQFYQQFTMDFEPPLVTIHFSSDAPVHVRSLLYVPAKRERNVLNIRTDAGLKLYAHNVMIQEYCKELLPKWLWFVDGVVDSEDLPLNVSRETIQNTRIMKQLGKTLRKRILREFNAMSKAGQAEFQLIWEQYGPILKEGLATDPELKEDLLPLLRFRSTKSEDDLTTLDGYIERMPEDQSAIYYLLLDDLNAIDQNPHLDIFRSYN